MKLESTSEFEPHSFSSKLSQEERNFFEAFRFTSWTGTPLKPNERRVVTYYSGSGLEWETATFFTADARAMFDHAFNIVKRVFEQDGKFISRVVFIQERKPKKQKDKTTIENTFAGEWHHHRLNARGEGKSSIVVLADKGSTEFADGTLEIGVNQVDIHEQAVDALKPGGTLTSKSLSSGNIGHFNKDTVHRRGSFEEDDPRAVLLVEYED